MNFVAVDVETSNPDMASICQIGAARFLNGEVVAEWKTLVNAGDYFHPVNVSIHGIDEDDVEGAPDFMAIFPKLNELIGDSIAVCHTHFDRVAIDRAAAKHNLQRPSYRWLDTASVARRAWAQFARRGYGLRNVCDLIGFEFQHHDALEDAKAAGNILMAAVKHTGLDPDQWLTRVLAPIDNSEQPRISKKGTVDGPLSGETIVFTGALEISRRDATDMALQLGCDVAPNVTRDTTMLVVGDQDVQRLSGHTKSTKHRKAEQLIEAGRQIRIVCESDFRALLRDTLVAPR